MITTSPASHATRFKVKPGALPVAMLVAMYELAPSASGSSKDDRVVRITVIKTDGTRTARESHRDQPSRRPIISPLNIAPRYVAVVSTRAAAGSSHVPPLRATASLWMVSTIAPNEIRRVPLLPVSTSYRMIATTAKPSSVHAPMSQASIGGSVGSASGPSTTG